MKIRQLGVARIARIVSLWLAHSSEIFFSVKLSYFIPLFQIDIDTDCISYLKAILKRFHNNILLTVTRLRHLGDQFWWLLIICREIFS